MNNKKENTSCIKSYIPSLNGIRAISIIFVIIGHINFRLLGQLNIPFPFTILGDGYFGVNVFFVISGFLISKLLIKEEHDNIKVNLKNFYIRRMFRIFPAYYFILLIYFILQVIKVLHFTNTSWLSSIFYYKYITGGDWESGHFWSLSVEEHFYLIWPLVFIFFKKIRIHFSFFVIFFVILCRLNAYYNLIPISLLTSSLSIFLRADALMIGCLLAIYENKISRLVLKYSKSILNPVIIIGILLLFNSPYLIQLNMVYKLHLGFIIIPLGLGSSIGIISNILIALLIIIFVNQKGLWFSFLNNPFINYFGKLSYSLYLWQQLFFSYHVGIFGKLPINLLCIFLAANLSYYIIERPFLKLKNKFIINKQFDGMILTKWE